MLLELFLDTAPPVRRLAMLNIAQKICVTMQ